MTDIFQKLTINKSQDQETNKLALKETCPNDSFLADISPSKLNES